MNLRQFRVAQRNLSNAEVSYFDVAIVGIDVDWFAGQLPMHQLILMQKIKPLQYFIAPIFDHYKSRQFYLFQVFSDIPGRNQLRYQNQIGPVMWNIRLPHWRIWLLRWFLVDAVCVGEGWRAIFIIIVIHHKDVLVAHIHNVIEYLKHFLDVFAVQLLQRIHAPSYFTSGIVVKAAENRPVQTFGN